MTVTIKRYCPACGAQLDDEGICTRETCPRRKLQLTAKEKKEAAEAAREEAKAQAQGL